MDFDDPSSSDDRNAGELQSQSFCSESSSVVMETQRMPLSAHTPVLTSATETMVNLINDHNDHFLFFEDGNEGVVNGEMEIVRHLPQPTVNAVGEEHLHHQLVVALEDTVRPLARHGCATLTRSGRLGDPTDDTQTYGDSVEKEEIGKLKEDEVEEVEVAPIEDSKEWDSVFGPMTLVDITFMSRFYLGYDRCWDADAVDMEEPTYDTETMVKTISLFYVNAVEAPQSEADETVSRVLSTLQRLASHMRSMQRILTEAGLTLESQIERREGEQEEGEGEGEENNVDAEKGKIDLRSVVCRGVHSVHVDSSCRLIGVIDVDTCVVSFSDVIAFSRQPFLQHEIVAILKSIIHKVTALHAAGITHGCLHGGNVLCSTDDGRTTLTGVCGIMSNPLFPTDPSFLSPRLAAAIQPLVKLIWDHKQETGEDAFSWASDPAYHCAVLERYGCTAETPMGAQVEDDVYAIGILTLSCLLGVPPFHSATLKEVVDVLAPHQTDGSGDTLIGDAFTSSYAEQRFKLAGYSKEFVTLAKDFVVMCLGAGLGSSPGSSIVVQDLLMHSFFTKHSITPHRSQSGDLDSSDDMDEVEELVLIDRTVHCLVYPIFTVMECARRNCGTSPLLPRLYRNSVFAARWNALRESPLYCTESNSVCRTDVVSVLWPYLDKSHVSCLVGSHEDNKSKSNGQKEKSPESLLYHSLSVSCLSSSHKVGDTGKLSLEMVAKAKGMRIDLDSRTLFFSGKSNDRLVLHRDELPIGYRSLVDTLVLEELKDCVVEVIMGFRYVLLRDVRSCKILLGPCYYIYLEEVTECSPISVASVHMFFGNVSRVDFCHSGCKKPRCLSVQAVSEEVSFTPYNIAYAGISEDFAAISLPQECVSFMLPVEDVTGGIVPASRNLNLHNTLRGGFDYPYAHALAAFGSRIAHVDDGISDVFLFFSEIAEKSICIAHINGGYDSTVIGSSNIYPKTSSHLSSWISRCTRKVESQKEKENGQDGCVSYPIIFMMDILADCVIEDCSFCTIFLVGSVDSISVRRCSELRLFLIAKDVLFEECKDLEVHLLVTELLIVDRCSHVEFFPLALKAPHVEEILTTIVDSCNSGSLYKVLEKALRQKDVCTLNALLRADKDVNAIDMMECEAVRIHNTSERIFLIDFVPGEAPLSTFFYEAYQNTGSVRDWVEVPFMQYTWGIFSEETPNSSALLPPVRFHDLVNASILRLPGTLNLRATDDKNLPLVDVVIDRVVFGVVHLVEALGTLFIRRCIGPLDIIVCSVGCVIMESCEHVTLQTACGTFTAKDCHSCHIALHVNTPPQYEACTGMQVSTLNITSEDFESYLERSGVQPDVNLFDRPMICSLHKEGDVFSLDGVADDIVSIDSLDVALTVLHKPVTIVPPLPGICLGIKDASFLGLLEDRVIHEERARKSFETNINAALLFLARRQVETLTATDNLLKNTIDTTDYESHYGRSSSLRFDSLAPEEVKKRHFDPLVGCSTENIGSQPFTTPKEKTLAFDPQPTDETVCLDSQKSGSVHEDGEISRTNSVHGDDTPFTSSSSFSHVEGDVAVNHGDVSATVLKGNESCEEAICMDRQNSTETKQSSCFPCFPQDSTAYALSVTDIVDATVDLASNPAVSALTQGTCKSKTRQFPALRSSSHNSEVGENTALSAGSSPAHSLKAERNNNNDNKQKNDNENTMPEQTAIGSFAFRDIIVNVHPDDEEEVRSTLCKVEAGREAALTFWRASGSSIKELERRVTKAIGQLKEFSK